MASGAGLRGYFHDTAQETQRVLWERGSGRAAERIELESAPGPFDGRHTRSGRTAEKFPKPVHVFLG